MRFHVDVRASFAVLVLASMLGGCDPKSTEVGATVADFGTPTSGDASSTGSGSGGDTGFGSTDCEEGWVAILSGTVQRELGDHTWNESFVPTSEAFVHLYLVNAYPDGSYIGRGEALVPFEGLPFEFALCFPEDTTFKFEGDEDYELWVHVFNHDTSETRVGDLAHEYGAYPVGGPTHGMQIVVGGVEHCDEPYADELCSTVVDDSNEGSGG